MRNSNTVADVAEAGSGAIVLNLGSKLHIAGLKEDPERLSI